MSGHQRNDLVAMNCGICTGRNDKSAVRPGCEKIDSTFDLARITHIDRPHLHTKEWRSRLNCSELCGPLNIYIAKDDHSR